MGGKAEGEGYDRNRVQAALDALANGSDPVGVRDGIVASWRRSQAHGVGREALSAPYDESALDRESLLVRAADPVLGQLAEDLTHSPSCVVLADHRGRILRRVTGDPRFDAALDAVLVAPGFNYSERHVGTNALGTALHERAMVVVHEREHFNDRLARLCCSAAPVRDPLTGQVLGALAIAAPARSGDAAWAALARQSGLLVENRLFDFHADGQRELYSSYLGALR
jgi:sigma-54 dependent transcriptional regulator, acetoin dehydrogenase operon transcriptional activator AcoR